MLHAVADKGGTRRVRGVRRVMSLPLASARLNLVGVADVVEFTQGPTGEVAFPVEYKRGKPKLHRADEVQLCAQALCLEEMTGHPVPSGALFYAETHRRVQVPFDEDLRTLTEGAAVALAKVFTSRQTPPPTPHKSRCKACSLHDLCRPETYARPVKSWRDQMVLQSIGKP